MAKLLKDKDVVMRYTAAEAIGSIGVKAKRAVPQLAHAAAEDNAAIVRLKALAALESIGPEAKAAVRILVGILEKEDRLLGGIGSAYFEGLDIGVVAGLALTKVDPSNPALVPGIIKKVACNNLQTRLCALETLRQLGPRARAAIPTVRKRLGDEEETVRKAARQTLDAIEKER